MGYVLGLEKAGNQRRVLFSCNESETELGEG